uniref:Reverse transcriptase domain-containing protein n=1 Tax=Tanacetum cinerariifolium TaxID=118510 RepID=A0A6L2MH02_TANCI|nr:reverse transcriptase domain-containing protein [Tanacetum cinerariifolium]
MNERCSTVLLNKLLLKEKDPRSFTIPCQVLDKRKEAEDLAADHLSRFENPHMEVLTAREIADKFSDEHLMVLKFKFNNDEPWYADFVNYIVGKRCVTGSETLKILAHCHLGPTGGHHGALVTAKKVYESRFYWPGVFKDANDYVRRCDACQRLGNIYSRNEMPQNNIQLSLEKLNYNSLSSYFKIHLGSLGLKNHIEDPSTSTSTIVLEWSKIDDLIKMWILGTLSESLQDEVVTTLGTAKDI